MMDVVAFRFKVPADDDVTGWDFLKPLGDDKVADIRGDCIRNHNAGRIMEMVVSMEMFGALVAYTAHIGGPPFTDYTELLWSPVVERILSDEEVSYPDFRYGMRELNLPKEDER